MYFSEESLEALRKQSNIKTIEAYLKISFEDEKFILGEFEGRRILVNKYDKTFMDLENGISGDLIGFMLNEKEFSFEHAVKLTCPRENLAYHKIQRTNDSSEQKRILKINSIAADYYYQKAKSGEGHQYLKDRKIKSHTAQEFKIGYSDGEGLLSTLISYGYSEEACLKSGLFFESGEEKFKDRLIFPICDYQGQVIGFGGRTINGNSAKYINSQSSSIFDKGMVLYGISIARRSKKPFLIITEGYMDTLSLHQAGFRNAVASMGTALTEEQAKLIASLSPKVYLSQDSDAAGIIAKRKSAEQLARLGVSVFIVDTSPFKDPDELINALGAREYQKRLEEAEEYKAFAMKHPLGKSMLERCCNRAELMIQSF